MKYVMEVWDKYNKKDKKILVDNGAISFCTNSVESRKNVVVNTQNILVNSGKVTLDKDVGYAFAKGVGMSYIKRLLLHGYSSFIHVVDLEFESLTESKLKQSRTQLATCPTDYVHAVRVPLKRLTPSWVRKLKQLSIPLIIFTVDKHEEIIRFPWIRLIEAAFPIRTMFLLDQHQSVRSKRDIQSVQREWEQTVKNLRLNSYFHLPAYGEEVPLFFLKRLGMYPYKGSFDSGSHADYMMYLQNKIRITDMVVPDIIALRGTIVKSNNSWHLRGVVGKEMVSIIPEQFLPIAEVFQYNS
ncbi:hypothetical protein CR194_03035 [Salipaludibacillus keqinensis]|uniref:Uncharacterized protein n=1 Tax=Salipaludibacillus keqinensis TaxID=2045207 RepID=A0A323TPE9_9BACI|nr:hypothetical protein [Salipaludibacillus keqinensis]PYZ94523.1 hypothetical protein CR194_03035 [Salipaludibacillus keqinensis]